MLDAGLDVIRLSSIYETEAVEYEDQPAFAGYADPPEPHQCVLRTFCGT